MRPGGFLRRLRGLVAAFVATGLLLACGGGGDDKLQPGVAAADESQSSTAAALSSGQALSSQDPVDLSVISLTKVSEKRVSRTVFDYVFRVTIRNDGEAQAAFQAEIVGTGPGTTVIDGHVEAIDLAAGATVSPADTVTLRHDRAFPFDPAALGWRMRGVPAVPTIVPGANLSNFPAGRATVGSPYEATLRIVPVDTRNSVASLEVSNPTPGGSSPGISLAGLLTWTPNEADFATTALHIVARLQDGSSSAFDVPVTVTKHRLVANVPLNGAGRYSDPEGRYLVDVSPALPGGSVTGTLSISERYQISGAFSNAISSSDSSHVILVITAPTGVPFPVDGEIAVKSPRKGAPAVRNGPRPQSAPLFTAYGESITGAKVDTGTNLYTTRQGIQGFKDVDVARIEANCDLKEDAPSCNEARLASATPVILVHGFTPESFGLGGGTGTWGELGSKLDGLGHPVFELRWRTLMRFEEAAGLLVRLAQRVSDKTGRKPFIIAHSFGGVVSHLALAGKAIAWNDDTKAWVTMSAGTKLDPLFDGLITLASPLSGINDDTSQPDFVVGRYWGDIAINACGQVSCAQAGAFDMIELSSLQRNVAVVKSKTGDRPGFGNDSYLKTGESIESIRNAWDGDAIALPSKNIHTVVAMRDRPFADYVNGLDGGHAFALGDGLISMIGQAVLPSDFTCQTAITDPHAYDFPGCLDKQFGSFLLAIDIPPAEGSAKPMDTATLGGRNYYFASRAAHSSVQVHMWWKSKLEEGFNRDERPAYQIAYYEDNVVVGQNRGDEDYYASHPLRYFIDNILKRSGATPAPTPPFTAIVKGVVEIKGDPIDWRTVPAWASIIRVDGESPVGRKQIIELDVAGKFSFDAEPWLRAELGPGVKASEYKIRAEFGDGVLVEVTPTTTASLIDGDKTYDLGVVSLTRVASPPPLVRVTGHVKDGATGKPLDTANVWLARGVNLGPAEVRGWPDSNVARHVTTDASGGFSVASLRAGDYTLLASRTGFADVLLGKVSVAEGQVIQVEMWSGVETLIHADAFDGVGLENLNPFWIPQGQDVVLGDPVGWVSLRENVTDTYVNIHSRDFTPVKNLRVRMTHALRPGGGGNFFPWVGFRLTDGDQPSLRWTRSNYAPDYCNKPGGYDKVVFRTSGACIVSDVSSSALFNRTLVSEIEVDFTLGYMKYDVDGDGSIDFVATFEGRPDAKIIGIELSGYGWYTGHRHEIDHISIWGKN